MFCADMEAIALEKALAGSIAKLSNLEQMPTAAEATTPSELTMALMMRKEKLTIVSCSETGSPNLSSRSACSGSMRKLCSEKVKIKSLLLRKKMARIILIP